MMFKSVLIIMITSSATGRNSDDSVVVYHFFSPNPLILSLTVFSGFSSGE